LQPRICFLPFRSPFSLRLRRHLCSLLLMRFAFILLNSSFILSSVIAANAQITEADLVRRTQELYDSIVSGNQEPWKKYFADDCTFSDEKGRTFDKARLVADVAPLPKGYSGTIKIENVISRIVGNTAVLSYDANETETIFGQELHARYHIPDTWVQRDGQWQILASQAHRYYEAPAAGQIDERRFRDYVGRYELAPGQVRTITAFDGNL